MEKSKTHVKNKKIYNLKERAREKTQKFREYKKYWEKTEMQRD